MASALMNDGARKAPRFSELITTVSLHRHRKMSKNNVLVFQIARFHDDALAFKFFPPLKVLSPLSNRLTGHSTARCTGLFHSYHTSRQAGPLLVLK